MTQPQAGPPVFEAITPRWLGWKIHIYVAGYQPGPKRRGIPEGTPLCGAFVHRGARRVPLGDALRWPERHVPTDKYDPPLHQWVWCRACVGHAVYLGGLLDETIATLATTEVKAENVQGHLGPRA